ncbi:homoserine kinase [Priestia flexa]|uniref:homoserine kinase n=1 Tax=Priestia flexa TaxID=86664 RepID=UPI001CD7C1AF|nr:homoserine kinase [Priestia flexa]MCA1202517.1 homoserine kinase [Priestia flexa]
MLTFDRFKITVPASSANLGPGFDSIGIALGRYLILTVEPAEQWVFVPKTADVEGIPTGKDNLVYQVAEDVAKQYEVTLPAAKVYVSSDIPLARGLGSSASAIVAGIELANQLAKLNLSQKDKLRISSLMEGHPDNVSPSIYGGVVIGYHHEDETYINHIPNLQAEVIMIIPRYELKTADARNALPKVIDYRTAVEAGAIGNMLVSALMNRDFEAVGTFMEKDLYHELYRTKLVPELAIARVEAKRLGAYGTVLSGAGPSVLCLAPIGKGKDIAKHLAIKLSHCEVDVVGIDTKGVYVDAQVVTN